MAPSVSLIVLNWNGRHFLPACLHALSTLDYPDYSITVVDNASDDTSVAYIQDAFPQVKVIVNEINRGFAGGNNVALRELETEFAVLVNPDVVVTPDWLWQLMKPLQADEHIGVAGCKLYYPGRDLLQHAGGFITMPRGIPGHYGGKEADNGQYDTLCDVDYVIGAAMVLRRTMLADIGLFDEGYFLYFEDVDLCMRARLAQYRVVYVPEATAVHVESVVTRKGSYGYLHRFHSGRWRFLLKYMPLTQLLTETQVTERRWLAVCGTWERTAVAQAYTVIGRQLTAVWRDRMSQEEETANQRRQVATMLAHLHRAAWHLPENSLDTLTQKGSIQTRPLRSHLPVVGWFITWCRQSWNRIAAKPYVDGLVSQQNGFNQVVLSQLRHQLEQLRILQTRLMMYEDWQEMVETAVQMNQTLQALEQRISQLESTKID